MRLLSFLLAGTSRFAEVVAVDTRVQQLNDLAICLQPVTV